MAKQHRRRWGACVAGIGIMAASLGSAGTASGNGVHDDFRISLTVGPVTDGFLGLGIVYHDGNRVADSAGELQRMFRRNGATEVWARTNTRDEPLALPPAIPGDYSFNTAIRNGKLAERLELDFNVELMLARTYGDVTCQTPPDFSDYPSIDVPGPWETLTIEQMETVLWKYGKAVARRFERRGIDVDVWDLGNETEYGTAGLSPQPLPGACNSDEGQADWYRAPDGVNPAIGQMTRPTLWQMNEPDRIAWLETNLWPHQARLMAAVQDGIRSIDPVARFSTHVSGLGLVTPTFATAYFGALEDGGVDLDESGMSYFPSSENGIRDIADFKDLVATLVQEFDRPVFLAESAYPSDEIPDDHSFSDWDFQVSDYSLTPEGQAAFFEDLAAWGSQNGLSGIRPFYPEVIAFWGPQLALFDGAGVSKPALSAVREGLLHGDPDAFG